MRLLSADIRRFRNLAQVRLEPGPRATVLVGENGQGKTNTLEALYYAATLKPLRATRLAELVQFGETETGTDLVATTGALMLGRTDSVAVAGAQSRRDIADHPDLPDLAND